MHLENLYKYFASVKSFVQVYFKSKPVLLKADLMKAE